MIARGPTHRSTAIAYLTSSRRARVAVIVLGTIALFGIFADFFAAAPPLVRLGDRPALLPAIVHTDTPEDAEGPALFAVVRAAPGEHAAMPEPVDVILLDVDHTPQHTLHPSHADLYTVEGFERLARHLRPGGVFALWSDEPPHPESMAALTQVFARVDGHTVEFPNPLTGGTSTNGVYVARAGR